MLSKNTFSLPISAGPRGLEPRTSVLETDVLPLNYRPNTYDCFRRSARIVGES